MKNNITAKNVLDYYIVSTQPNSVMPTIKMQHNSVANDLNLLLRTIAIARLDPTRKQSHKIIEAGMDFIQNADLSNNALDAAKREYEKTIKFGGNFLPFYDERYPKLLLNTPKPPLILVYLGNIERLNSKVVAMVGSRAASYNGLQMAYNMAQDFHAAGWMVISGLAKGIDAKSHLGAINSTIAVIGGGISSRYPSENAKLYDQIIADGSCILTEFHIDAKPIPANFPMRNAIIAGISLATVVVEAGMQSGSLVTARLAREFNRDVFAIPGFPMDPRFKGGNYLIKNNIAKLIESAQEVIEELGDLNPTHTQRSYQNVRAVEDIDTVFRKSKPEKQKNIFNTLEDVSDDSGKILNALSSEYITVDEVCTRTYLPAHTVNIILMQLEMEGKVMSNGINGYCRKFDR